MSKWPDFTAVTYNCTGDAFQPMRHRSSDNRLTRLNSEGRVVVLTNLGEIERRLCDALRKIPKPRARYTAAGVGYWVVRNVHNGTIYQGIGRTLPQAYASWATTFEKHVPDFSEPERA